MSGTIITIVAIAIFILTVAVLGWLNKKLHIWRGFLMRMRSRREGPFPYKKLIADPLPTAACVDFGAFRNPLQNLPGLNTVVLMIDRAANEWFLSYDLYMAERNVLLDRHGPLKFYSTEADLRKLVVKLHTQGIKVLIGFWAFWGDSTHKPGPWIKRHPELKPRQRNESDFGNLFVFLKPEGITLAEYICKQYEKLWRNFGFDGLFLGDGFCGFRNFLKPWLYGNKSNTIEQSAGFYRLIAQAIHKTNGELWSYDCMGFSYVEAWLHGADYKLLADAGLDVLVFQSYPTAWGQYFRISGKNDLRQDLEDFLSVRQILMGKRTRVYYSLEMGDNVEGWWPSYKAAHLQMKLFQKKADGKFLVWGNDVISRL